jgi:hypothetical protein
MTEASSSADAPTSTWSAPRASRASVPPVSSTPATAAYGSANPPAAAPTTPSPTARDSRAPRPSSTIATPAAAIAGMIRGRTDRDQHPEPGEQHQAGRDESEQAGGRGVPGPTVLLGTGRDLLDDVVVLGLGPGQVARTR